MKIQVLVALVLTVGVVASPCHADTVVDFNELEAWTFTGGTGSYYNGNNNGQTNNNGWVSGGVHFGNYYSSAWGGLWNGFAYSNVNDTQTAGNANQYAAITGAGYGGSGNYAVVFQGSHSYFDIPIGWQLASVQLTNTTYAALSMQNGDTFSKKFGGPTGNDPDFFSVTLTGYDGLGGIGTETGSIEFFLADFRFADNSLDYILNEWTEVNLSTLRSARSVRFTFDSSDVGAFGINTPLYVAVDQLRFSAIPEPNSGVVLLLLGAFPLLRRRC